MADKMGFWKYLMNRIGGYDQDDELTPVTLDAAIQVPVVRYALGKVTSAIAQVPFKIMENTEDGQVPATKHKWYFTTNRRPNSFTNKYDFMEFLLTEAIMYGDGRAVIDSDSRELLPLFFQHTVTVWQAGKKYHVTKIDQDDPVWRFEPSHRNGKQANVVVFKDDEVIHIRGLSSNAFTGSGILDCKRTIRISIDSEETVEKQLNKGFSGTLMLEAPAGVFRREEDAKQFLEDFSKRHTGPEAAGKPGLLREGVKANIVTMTNVDSQMIEQRRFNREDVALLFGLETIMGEDKSVSYNSAEQKNQQEVRNCFMRWCRKLCEEFEAKLLSEADLRMERYCFEFDFSGYLKPDSVALSGMLIQLRNAMIITANEARAELGYNKIDGGDELVNPATLSSSSKMKPMDLEEMEADQNDAEDAADAEDDAKEARSPNVVENMVRALIRRESRDVCNGTKKADFLGWMDKYYAGWEPKLADKLEELGIDRGLATDHCNESKESLLRCADSKPDEFANVVKDCVQNWESRVYKIVNCEVIK